VHVGLNLIYLVPRETGGMETYARELVPRLAAIDGLHVTVFVNREAAQEEWLSALPHVVVPVHARRRAEWVRGEQEHLPRLARRAGCDVVHSLASTAPVWGRFARVTTIHDLHYKLAPDAHFGVRALGMRLLVPAAARRSHRIIAVSHSTAQELVTHVGIPRQKIDVVWHGVGGVDRTAARPEGELRARFDLGRRPLLLTAAAKRPHKNLMRLLEAHARLPPESRPILVMPGYPTPHEEQLAARARELGTADDVRMPHWVSDADLEGLYAAASAFVLPSLHEGFGMPVLEAMARGLPVATSDRAALAEVADDAALLFDPTDVDSIADALAQILRDDVLRARLRAAGVARAAQFTWERAAAQTVASYESAVAEAR
jgi:glycosyltransferase involved in cell wall biosynthesis